jgi:methionyl-tRNA formyltransferase
MKIIFMGTPESAVPTLQRCIDDGHRVVSVWTQPDRPAGRGNKIAVPPVKEFALSRGINVNQPAKIRTGEALDLFNSAEADVAVVVAYGRILPPTFLQALPLGCINVHFSLLPLYRGAAPVNWSIVRGENETGVTTMQMSEGLDTGPILLQRSTSIGSDETAEELMARLALDGADLLGETLARLDQIEPREQDEAKATFAPMLERGDGLIDWTIDAFQIERRVRGLQPWPNAFTKYRDARLVIWQASAEKVEQRGFKSGQIERAHGDHLSVVCGDQTVLHLLEVQPEGKRRMKVRDYLNGVHVAPGEMLG